jgi:hypothetical protein
MKMELPLSVQIETAMACNLRCPMCPVPTAKVNMEGRSAGIMSVATFDRIVDQISDKPRTIGLTMMGEPTLNKHLVYFVRKARERGHYVAMTTNGTLLDEKKSRELLAAGLNNMKVSFDGATKATYERIRIGADFDEVVANVKRFDAIRKEIGSDCVLGVHCIDSNLTHGELGAFEEMWAGIADSCDILKLQDWVGQMEIPPEFGFTPSPATEHIEGDAPIGCHLIWDVLSIAQTGSPIYCCFDYKLQSNLPSVHEKPLIDIWNDEIATERRKHETNTVDSAPCAGCGHWKNIKRMKEAAAIAA